MGQLRQVSQVNQVKNSSADTISQSARKKAAEMFQFSPNRCQNTFIVGKKNIKDVCNKRMLIDKETGQEFCPQCKTVEKEDQQLATEAQEMHVKEKVLKLFRGFEDGSLINQKLKKAIFQNYVPPSQQLHDAKEREHRLELQGKAQALGMALKVVL